MIATMPTHKFWREVRDYLMITLGLVCYASGWAFFLLPYQITAGGFSGISAIIYYVSGIGMEVSFFVINAAMLLVALKVLGLKFCLKTIYAVCALTFRLWLLQLPMHNESGEFLRLAGEGQEFLATVIGSALLGVGLAIVFLHNGSTGGTDIIAMIVNKYRDVTLGRMMMLCDVVIISSCYFIFADWRRVIFGFITLGVMGFVLDYVVNSARRSVQFFIITKHWDEICREVNTKVDRGTTVIDGTGWYSGKGVKIVFILAKQSQSVSIFRLIKEIDPDAFVSQSNVIGVYGEGFDKIKGK